jgi:hypothetical protein
VCVTFYFVHVGFPVHGLGLCGCRRAAGVMRGGGQAPAYFLGERVVPYDSDIDDHVMERTCGQAVLWCASCCWCCVCNHDWSGPKSPRVSVKGGIDQPTRPVKLQFSSKLATPAASNNRRQGGTNSHRHAQLQRTLSAAGIRNPVLTTSSSVPRRGTKEKEPVPTPCPSGAEQG